MTTTPSELVRAVSTLDSGMPANDAVRGLHFSLDGNAPIIPAEFLEHVPRCTRLNRPAAALLLDTCARACADARGVGTRAAVFAAWRIKESLAYQRLGFRNDADYARELLGVTPRVFRDLARLGERLAPLPLTRSAFLSGEITRCQADTIARVATRKDESDWLARAHNGTVRALKAAAREAKDSVQDSRETGADASTVGDTINSAEAGVEASTTGDTESFARARTEASTAGSAANSVSDGADDGHNDGDRAEGGAVDRAYDGDNDGGDERRRVSFEVPATLLGKIDSVLTLAARAAGAQLPEGALWELIAAEYLSGAAPEECHGASLPGATPECDGSISVARPDTAGRTPRPLPSEVEAAEPLAPHRVVPAEPIAPCGVVAAEPVAPRRVVPSTSRPPEDPLGHRRILEDETSSWSFLPSERAELELHGAWLRVAAEAHELGEGDAAERLSPWDLHDRLLLALRQDRNVNWQLGRLLTAIRNRRLWKTLAFASFSHYVTERLAISPRHAERVIRAERAAQQYPELASLWTSGELSGLQSEMLARVMRTVRSGRRQAWIELASRSTCDRFARLVRCAERLSRERDRVWLSSGGDPRVAIERSLESATAVSRATAASRDLAVVGDPSTARRPHATTFVTTFASWLTIGEHETLQRALQAAESALRSSFGETKVPEWRCLDALLDAFLAEYQGDHAQQLRGKYPIFERDGWQCRVPGCRAFSALHAHHIVFRSHGGGDEAANLVALCDFHHRSLHRRWIRVVGRAPEQLYWELGIDASQGPSSRAPVARFFHDRKLSDDEYWDGKRVRSIRDERSVA